MAQRVPFSCAFLDEHRSLVSTFLQIAAVLANGTFHA